MNNTKYWKVLVDDNFETKVKELSIIGGYPICLGYYSNGETVGWSQFIKSNKGLYIHIRVTKGEGWGWIPSYADVRKYQQRFEYCGEYSIRKLKLQKINDSNLCT